MGIPGRYGSCWIMLQALLASAGLTPDDVDIRLYPDFGQGPRCARARSTRTGFANNEPVQLARRHRDNVLTGRQEHAVARAGPDRGQSLGFQAHALEAFVAATLRAMEEITANPQLGLDDSIAYVPELAADRQTQLAVLNATVEMWPSQYTRTSTAWAPSTRAPGPARSRSCRRAARPWRQAKRSDGRPTADGGTAAVTDQAPREKKRSPTTIPRRTWTPTPGISDDDHGHDGPALGPIDWGKWAGSP